MPSARRWARRWTSCSGKTEPQKPRSQSVKVFCPAFLQKSGRGPGAAPPVARRSARNAPCAKEAQEGRPRKSNENAARSGGVFTISRIVTRARKIPRHAVRSAGTRRGRRPRRPLPSSTAGLTAFLQPHRRGGVPPPRPACVHNRRYGGAHGLRAAEPPAKGEPPARVPPLTPSCASLSIERRPGAPPLDPARFFVKKRGKKLLNASLHPTQAPRPWGE